MSPKKANSHWKWISSCLLLCKQIHKHSSKSASTNSTCHGIPTILDLQSLVEACTVCVNSNRHRSLQTLREGGKAMWPPSAFKLKGCAGQAWRLHWCKPRQCWYISIERSGGSPAPGHRPPDRQTHTLQLWNAYEIFDFALPCHASWEGNQERIKPSMAALDLNATGIKVMLCISNGQECPFRP